MKRLFRCSAIVLAVAVLLVIVLVVIGPSVGDSLEDTAADIRASSPTTAPNPQQIKETVSLSRWEEDPRPGGEVTIPGGQAFIDGRDLMAQPPGTWVVWPVWERPGPDDRGKKACEVKHGQEVTLLEYAVTADPPRQDFYITTPGCEGWIWDMHLSTEKHDPVGDLMGTD